MRYIFFLSGDYLDLGREEIASLFDIKSYKIIDNLLIADLNDNKKFQRLALTKSIYQFLFECKVDELSEIMKKYDWNSIYKNSFCIRVHNLNEKNNNKNQLKNKINKKIKKSYSEKDLAGYIWRSITNPEVDLENPKTEIELFLIKNKVYCGLLIFKNRQNFEARKPNLRPFANPSSLHPKLARALVNIAGIKEDEVLLDPFCGTGGFLIEAGLMGIKTIGYDISKNMADGCEDNMKFFKIKNFKIKIKNALKINKKIDYVVTDLPYGLNSNVYLQYNKNSINDKSNKINLKINKENQIKNIENFYLKFLKKVRKILKKRAVIIFPSFVDYKKILKKSKFTIEKEFEICVHRSLTRKIVKII